MRNKVALLLSITLFVATACTKKNPHIIAVDSPFEFEYDSKLQGTEFVAVLGEDKITHSQLISPSPALIELEQRINDIILKKIYESAKDEDQITFGFTEPEGGVKKVLDKSYNEKIQVTFDPQLKGGIAKVNNQVLDIGFVSKNDTLLARLDQSRFEQSIKALEGLFARRKVLEASKTAGTTMEEYIRKTIVGSQLTASDADVAAFAKKNNISEKELTEKLALQIKDTIVSHQREKMINEYVAKNIVKSPIKVAFRKPMMTVSLPQVSSDAPHAGEGPITVILLSRWDCESCKTVAQGLFNFVNGQDKYFKLSYLFNFPINSNEERMISEAALCLQKQQSDYFWTFAGSLDPKSSETVEEAVNQTVRQTGADFDAFRSCFLAREFKDQVEAHLQGTKDLGFYKAPVVVLDGQVMEMPNVQQFMDAAMALKAEKGLGLNWFYKIKQLFN